MQAFSTTQANAITATQLGGLTTTAVGNFSTTQLDALTTTQTRGLTTTQLNALSAANLNALDLDELSTDAGRGPEHHRDRQPDRPRRSRTLTSTQVARADHGADRHADLDRDAGVHDHAGQCDHRRPSSAA